MKANELRIGNFVTIENKKYWEEMSGNPVLITGCKQGDVKPFPQSTGSLSLETIDKGLTFSQMDEFMQPIPLTEEWLTKFGFRKRQGNNICWDLGNFMVGWYGNKFATWVIGLKQENNEMSYHSKIYYVHQLQNLYFALTGEELEIKK